MTTSEDKHIISVLRELKEELRVMLLRTLSFEGIKVTMSVTKALDEFIDVDVNQALRKASLAGADEMIRKKREEANDFYRIEVQGMTYDR